MTMLILGIFIGAAALIHLFALMPKPGRVRDDYEPVSLDGMTEVFNPDPTMGAARMQSWREEGVF